jgi:hypothetical protein
MSETYLEQHLEEAAPEVPNVGSLGFVAVGTALSLLAAISYLVAYGRGVLAAGICS